MAREKRSGKEVADIGRQISDIARSSGMAEKQIEKVLMSGKKMSRGLAQAFKRTQSELLSGIRKQEKSLARLQRMQRNGANVSNNQIKAVQERINKDRQSIAVLDNVTKSTNNLNIRTMALSVTTGILSTAISTLEKAYKNWISLSEKTQAAMGQLAMRTGATSANMGELRGQLNQAAAQFGQLVGAVDGIQMGAQWLGEIREAVRDTRDLTPAVQQGLFQVSRGLGVGAQSAIQLMRALEGIQPDGNITDFSADMYRFAESIGAQAGVLTRDFVDARASVAQFGTQGVDTFKRAALMANQFGFETRKIFDMMKGFDTFGQASQNVNQLNAMLGTSLSSFELMVEQDPSRRLEMIRRAISDQGLEWNNMSRQQRMAVAQSVNLSEEEAARVFGQGESLQELERAQREAAEQQERDARIQRSNQELMNDLLRSTKERFETISTAIQRLFNSLSGLFSPIFGEINGGLTGMIDRMTTWIESARQNERIQGIIQMVARGINNVFDWIQRSLPSWGELEEFGVKAWTSIEGWATWAYETFQDIWQTIRDDVIPYLQDTWAEVQAGNHPINDLIDDAEELWEKFKKFFDSIKTGFNDIVIPSFELAGELVKLITSPLDSMNEAGGAGALFERIRGLDRQVMAGLGFGEGETRTQAQARQTQQRQGIVGGLQQLPDTSNMDQRTAWSSYYGLVRTLLNRGVRIADIYGNSEIKNRFEEFTPEGMNFSEWTRRIYGGSDDPHGIEERATAEARTREIRRAQTVQPAAIQTGPGRASGAARSAVGTAPATRRTAAASSAGGGRQGGRQVEIVASDIYLDSRQVGRAMFEVSRRT